MTAETPIDPEQETPEQETPEQTPTDPEATPEPTKPKPPRSVFQSAVETLNADVAAVHAVESDIEAANDRIEGWKADIAAEEAQLVTLGKRRKERAAQVITSLDELDAAEIAFRDKYATIAAS